MTRRPHSPTPYPESPFQAGRRLNASELVDREAEVRQVHDAMRRAGKLWVIGPRRYGKTSLVHAAREAAEADGVVVLWVDAEAFANVEMLAAGLLAQATKRLEPRIQRAQTAVSSFFSRLRPTVAYSPGDGSFSVNLGVDAAAAGGAVPLVTDVLDGIEKWAVKAKRRVAIVIDEVQELLEKTGRTGEGQFRAAVQLHERVGYIFAGSRARYLASVTSEPGAPFFNLGSKLYVGPIPDADFLAFLASAFAGGGFALAPEATAEILELAERVPYNVQLLADACWTELSVRPPARGAPWSATEVLATAEAMVRKLDPYYSPQWLRLSSPQRTALLAVVHEGGSGLTGGPVLRRYRLTASAMQKALGALLGKGVVFEEQAAGARRLRLQDPFFGIWVRLYAAGPSATS
jgi:hypothetical protein